MSISFFTIIFLLVIGLAVPMIIGVYVYRDAKRRNMNAALWTLIAMLAPSLIGFIIYLLVRGNYSNLRCPQCDATVTEQYAVCPRCSAKLRAVCPNCSFPIEPDWAVCPRCATSLDKCTRQEITPPIKPKDQSLGKILAVVLIIPILLIAFVILGTVSFTSTGASNITIHEADMCSSNVLNAAAAYEITEELQILSSEESLQRSAGFPDAAN